MGDQRLMKDECLAIVLPPEAVILCFLSYSKALTWESHQELLSAPASSPRQGGRQRDGSWFGWPPFLHPIPYEAARPRGHDPVSSWDLLASGVLAPCLLVSQHLQMPREALGLAGGIGAGSPGAALVFPLLFLCRGADAQAPLSSSLSL